MCCVSLEENKVLLEEDVTPVVTLGGPGRKNRSCGAGAAVLSRVTWRPHLDLIPSFAINSCVAARKPFKLSVLQFLYL